MVESPFLQRLAVLDEDVAAGDVQRISRWVRSLSTPESVCSLIGEIADSAESVAQSAAMSRTHPLGFDKLVLHATVQYQVRLHVWWPRITTAREDIHDHRFDLVSAVVTGGLYVEHFAESAASTVLMDGYVEEHVVGSGSYSFVPRGRVPIKQIGASMLSPGSVQFTSADVLHRVRAFEDELAISFFVKTPIPGKANTTVLMAADVQPSPEADEEPLGPELFRERAAAIVAALS